MERVAWVLPTLTILKRLMLPLLFVRTVREDRFLRGHLPVDREYAQRVHDRLVPGIW